MLEHALEEGCNCGVHDYYDRQVPHALGSDLLEGAFAALLFVLKAPSDLMVNTSVIHHNLSETSIVIGCSPCALR